MSKRIFTVPQNDNFVANSEFIRHKKIWLVWPERGDNWRLAAKPVQKIYVELINTLIKYQENINVLVSKYQFQSVRKLLDNQVTVIEMSTNDCFIKDYGPFFI